MNRLKGQVAPVPGGAHGIGQAVSEVFAEGDARVLVAGIEEQPGEATWPDDLKSFVSVQTALPFRSARTISYVGTRIYDMIATEEYDAVPPGSYTNLQAARPWPAFGSIQLIENIGASWYDGLHAKWECRFANGLSHTASYAFSKNLCEDEMPVGRGKKVLSSVHPVANGVLGGWQLSGVYSFTSGSPLSITVPGATLGNGYNTRANMIGNPRLDNPSTNLWYNPTAFQAPASYTFGNSRIGILDDPGPQGLDLAVMKHFPLTEKCRLQFRGELFNATNHVNLSNPNLNHAQTTTGKITAAGSARQVQLGLKVIF